MARKKKMKTMNIILIFMALFLLVFIVAMIFIYYNTGGIPDTLVVSVFTICGGEFGVMGWIKTTKDKYLQKDFEKESRKYMERMEKLKEVIDEYGGEE